MSTKSVRVRKSGDEEAEAADDVAEAQASTQEEPTATNARSPETDRPAGTMIAQRQELAAAGDSAATVGSATVQYDPGPDRGQLSSRYGIDLDCGGRAEKLQRLEADFGSDRVGDWADEGMPVGSMGKPQDMRAFRERQADRPGAVPADVERQNEASVQRNTGQADAGSSAGEAGVPTAVRDVVSSPGRSLEESVQRSVEEQTGQEFGDVRVHTGPKAARAAEQIDARAFTVGNHVAFNEGEYQPGTEEGQKVLAHELTHVRQQTEGAVSMLPKAGALQVDPDPSLEREAEETAERVVAGGGMAVSRSGTGMHVQRQPDSESEEDSGSSSDSDADSKEDDSGGGEGEEAVDARFVRAIFRKAVLGDASEELRAALATAQTVEEAQAALSAAMDTEAILQMNEQFAERSDVPAEFVRFRAMVQDFAPGEYVKIRVQPVAGMVMSMPSEQISLMDGVSTVIGIHGFEEPESTAKQVMAPFIDLIRDDDNPMVIPNYEDIELGEDSDGNPVLVMQQAGEEIEMDPQQALQEAVDIFMESEEGKALQETAKSLGEDAEEKFQEIWETTWGKFAIPGVVLSILGGVYATQTEIPDEAIEWAKDAMEVSIDSDSFQLEFDPKYEGDVFNYEDEEVPFDVESFGGSLDASYEFGDDVSASTTLDYLNDQGDEEFLGNLVLEGESWSFEGKSELEDEAWSGSASGEFEGENFSAEFDTELGKLRQGIETLEASAEGGYESESATLVGALDIQDTADKSHVLSRIEAEMGGEMWSVGADGELELSDKGHRVLGKIHAEVGGENWDLNAEGYVEDHSMDDIEAGGSMDFAYDVENFDLDAGIDYTNTGGSEELQSNLGLSYEAANRLTLKLDAMVDHAPDGTQLESDLQASYEIFDGLETDLGATYERDFDDPQGQLGISNELRYQFEQGQLHLQQTLNNDDYEVQLGVGFRF